MMGTVWLRLHPSQEYIQSFINAIVSSHMIQNMKIHSLTKQFFGSAFMSFMAVAYVPAFLEDRATFAKERANGLYGATPFMISNLLIGLPFLCMSPAPLLYSHNLTKPSPYIDALFNCLILAFQLPTNSRSVFHLGDVDLP